MKLKAKKTVDIFFRSYLFIYLILWILGFFAVIFERDIYTTIIQIELINFLFSIIEMIGLFAFTYKKRIFNPVFWKLYVPVMFAWHYYLEAFVMPIANAQPSMSVSNWFVVGTIINTPLYIALCLYAFKTQKVVS